MVAMRCSAGAVWDAIDQLGIAKLVSVAADNGPNSVVVAGEEASVALVIEPSPLAPNLNPNSNPKPNSSPNPNSKPTSNPSPIVLSPNSQP